MKAIWSSLVAFPLAAMGGTAFGWTSVVEYSCAKPGGATRRDGPFG